MANVLVIGGGGREHAITWKLSQSQSVKKIFLAPGSSGIRQVSKAENVNVNIKAHEEVVKFCKERQVELVVVGPEDPLANGLADDLNKKGIKVFGPQKNGATIESDKEWAKAFMDKYNIPTARWQAFKEAQAAKNYINSSPFPALVVKASGLAAGKGVVVAETKEEACKAVDEILSEKKFGSAGEVVVVEELLQGEECSLLAFCDGTSFKPMLPAQDHKRIFDGDAGPNTGGMGVVCPSTLIEGHMEYIKETVFERAIAGFLKEGIHYVGVLYAGLMMTPDGPKVLEFNCRFGDPETEVILPLLESDLYEIMMACCTGKLRETEVKWTEGVTAVGVVMASRGYPETSSKGQVITGIDKVSHKENHIVFHCGTALKDNQWMTNGGRVLIVVSKARDALSSAIQATQSCDLIHFDGRQFRKDIGSKEIVRSILSSGKLTYKASGVDISAGNDLVSHIKRAAKSTNIPGTVGGIGGFGGIFDLKAAGFKDPLLVSGTDGVGTKLIIARVMETHTTIGIDLVAMCVNDLLAHGATPLYFLDYFACGKLDVKVARDVVEGIADGCKLSGCSLIGGETAEMPGFYSPGEYDLAGFTVGAVEREMLLPRIQEVRDGDVVIGLPSSGVHSNGFSLVNKVLKLAGVKYTDVAPFSEEKKSIGQELLTPTKIYVKPVLKAMEKGKVKAFAHITGGGLVENIPRVLPPSLAVRLDAQKWKIPVIFPWLAATGDVNAGEMLRTFNCGIGGVLIVDPKDAEDLVRELKGDGAVIIGNVVKNNGNQVAVDHFNEVMSTLMVPFVGDKEMVRSILTSGKLTYKTSGVDISAGNDLVSDIKRLAKSTNRPGTVGGIGGFGGVFDLKAAGFKDPLLVSGTDGVGTKLKIARDMATHKTIGIDLGAMCVNDLLAHGADPLFFLDYFACGKLDVKVARDVVEGIADGCKLSGCSLIGGETAEMPGFYSPGEYDIAGFAVGAVEREMLLPRIQEVREGDVVIGLPSSGVHSNGFSLVNKVLKLAGVKYTDVAPFSEEKKSIGQELLTPTKIYVKPVLKAMEKGKVKAFAHITGGGLVENIPRVLPPSLAVRLDAQKWKIPVIFPWLAATGDVNAGEMLRTFNCGIGGVLIVDPKDAEDLVRELKGDGAVIIGNVIKNNGNQVAVDNFNEVMSTLMVPFVGDKEMVRSILTSGKLTYKTSGVDISAGNDLVSDIKRLAKSTNRPGTVGGIGGFGGVFDLKAAGFKDPLLVSGTDGVGTKLKIARDMATHKTIGIDLGAMCVNDLLAHGADPLFFLDYFACGKLDVKVARDVVEGIADGCKLSGCSLIGGETAEMPGFYSPGEYDIAGFAVGAVEREMLLPRIQEVREGDVVVGLPSSGVHSNGFSLVNKVLKLAGVKCTDVAPFSEEKKSIGEELLTPTKIYVKPVLKAMKKYKVKACAHITGGGLVENIPRVLPPSLAVQLDTQKWKMPAIFPWLALHGNINAGEMLRTFNCGIGIVLIVDPKDAKDLVQEFKGDDAVIIGNVVKNNGNQVTVNNFNEVMVPLMLPYLPTMLKSQPSTPKKKVGVLISGSGTNLQALIDATLDPEREMGAEIVLVISNKPGVEGLKRAQRVNIPTVVLSHKDYESRAKFDQAMNSKLEEAGVEIVCLAGFMRILTGEFTAKWKGRLLNVHPALLPSFKGTHAQRQALEAGVRLSGCTVHFVEEEVDAGAIIAQEAVPVEVHDTEETLTERIKTAEHRAFPRALKLVANGNVMLGANNKLVWT